MALSRQNGEGRIVDALGTVKASYSRTCTMTAIHGRPDNIKSSGGILDARGNWSIYVEMWEPERRGNGVPTLKLLPGTEGTKHTGEISSCAFGPDSMLVLSAG